MRTAQIHLNKKKSDCTKYKNKLDYPRSIEVYICVVCVCVCVCVCAQAHVCVLTHVHVDNTVDDISWSASCVPLSLYLLH